MGPNPHVSMYDDPLQINLVVPWSKCTCLCSVSLGFFTFWMNRRRQDQCFDKNNAEFLIHLSVLSKGSLLNVQQLQTNIKFMFIDIEAPPLPPSRVEFNQHLPRYSYRLIVMFLEIDSIILGTCFMFILLFSSFLILFLLLKHSSGALFLLIMVCF